VLFILILSIVSLGGSVLASCTLDDIRASAEAKYGSTDITVDGRPVVLLNPLRLGKRKRQRLTEIQTQLSSDEAVDQQVLLEEALLCVAASESQGQRLLDAIGDDLALLVSVFERYSEGTQAPEA
jgi:hypothetical protein